MAAPAGRLTVEVVPDVSQMEPMIRAELARIAGQIGVSAESLHETLHVYWHNNGGDLGAMAEALTHRFLIMERDASES